MDAVSDASLSLDLIGIKEATDKSSLIGDYLRHYERIFSNLRNENFNLIEIGVFRGASARTWAQFFTQARIIGVDIDPKCRAYASDRITIEIGSQNDPAFLHRLVTKYPPKVIIDDGSHQSYDVIFTFERLFPTLEPGGIYVIEDLHFHHLAHEAERLRGGSPILAHDYVTDLARERLGSAGHVKSIQGLKRHLVGSIDYIEIFSQAAVIHKKLQDNSLAALQVTRVIIEQTKNWNNWVAFSQKLLEAGGSEADVVHALKRAIEADPFPIVAYHRLSEALERMRHFNEAIGTLQQATVIRQDDPEILSELRERIRRIQRAGGIA